MSRLRTILALGIAALGCDGTLPLQIEGGVPAPGPAFLEPAPTRNTTSESIAVTNLEASIQAHRRRLAQSVDLPTATALVEELLLRASFYGTFDDWDEALGVSQAALEEHPNDPAAFLLRARILGRLHEFDEALTLVSAARDRTSEDSPIRARELEAQARHVEATAQLALGAPVEGIVAQRHALASSMPTYQNTTSLALALAQDNRFEEADAAFRRALEGYRDVSPFPFAWVAFQRGVMWSEQAGRPDLALPLYEEALGHLPGFVLANVHLAELDVIEGRSRVAIDRLLPLVETTQDPEPLAVLGTIEPGTPASEIYAAQAEAAYRRLIERFPKAFAHHGGGAP